MAGQIFTLNFGFAGNFSSAYFWQIQDMYTHPAEFHQAFFIQSSKGYFPRMLGIDFKESLSFPSITNTEDQILWGGKIQKIDQEQGTEEKWTDLLTGMVSNKNLVPVYRDESPIEEIEEKTRWFAENSDRLSGIHIIQDNDFSDIAAESLSVISDFYYKVPMMMFAMGFKYSLSEEMSIFKCADFSSLLYIPCTEANEKKDYSSIGVGLDGISYFYRNINDIGMELKPFLQFPRGNTCCFSLNLRGFGPSGITLYDKSYTRGIKNVEKTPIPQGFPIEDMESTVSGLEINTGISGFYGNFNAVRRFDTNVDEFREMRNYTQSIAASFEDFEFFD
ncbi:hypothetical protein SteCoe_29490 [Stentor coeruleus]|uniref:Misato Segment II tubulin-like domain-containing protein n=1 Tax=Stentor coeruleus TaxID=5963 RepID=A0A1R2B5S4_9CILI|nr:hypothetical protein SteCoe_29490 [Stentor coeruleus]